MIYQPFYVPYPSKDAPGWTGYLKWKWLNIAGLKVARYGVRWLDKQLAYGPLDIYLHDLTGIGAYGDDQAFRISQPIRWLGLTFWRCLETFYVARVGEEAIVLQATQERVIGPAPEQLLYANHDLAMTAARKLAETWMNEWPELQEQTGGAEWEYFRTLRQTVIAHTFRMRYAVDTNRGCLVVVSRSFQVVESRIHPDGTRLRAEIEGGIQVLLGLLSN